MSNFINFQPVGAQFHADGWTDIHDEANRHFSGNFAKVLNSAHTHYISCTARLKRDGTPAETRFCLSEKWTSPFKSAGESVQSTTGNRGVRISGQTMDRPCSEVQCKSGGYPLQSPISPSLPLPRVTVCHHVSNGLYVGLSQNKERIVLQSTFSSWCLQPTWRALTVPYEIGF